VIDTVHFAVKLPLVLASLLWCIPCAAQQTLGDLLDAGAKQLSVQQFMDDVVQRAIEGPLPAGGELQLVYRADGQVTGVGTFRSHAHAKGSARAGVNLEGAWKADEQGRICTALTIVGSARRDTDLPPRCQFWFRLGDDFFFADSDSDRYAKVLRRKVTR
jgi:hypothetical protein